MVAATTVAARMVVVRAVRRAVTLEAAGLAGLTVEEQSEATAVGVLAERDTRVVPMAEARGAAVVREELGLVVVWARGGWAVVVGQGRERVGLVEVEATGRARAEAETMGGLQAATKVVGSEAKAVVRSAGGRAMVLMAAAYWVSAGVLEAVTVED